MSQQIEEQLLNALELFQYANRFRKSLFVLVFGPGIDVNSILTDLKLLQTSKILTAIVCKYDHSLETSFAKLNARGFRFAFRRWPTPRNHQPDLELTTIAALAEGAIPVYALEGQLMNTDDEGRSLFSQAADMAHELRAAKVVFLSDLQGLKIDNRIQSHIQPNEIPQLISEQHSFNVDRKMLELIASVNSRYHFDVVILDYATGSLFQEIFTHKGRGTLFSNEYSTAIRRAKLEDVFDISRLLRPYINSGTVRPVTDDQIAEHISDYFVFTINSAIVASAQLADYGEADALAKICTLPRYRGKGRAKQLARKLIEEAKARQKKYVFGLSIEPRMWIFFTSLGFTEIDRSTLPDSWKENYDFSRPSKAFRLDL